jgi:hypothetical protein
MSNYLKQKLFQALHDLVGAGDLDMRMDHASASARSASTARLRGSG